MKIYNPLNDQDLLERSFKAFKWVQEEMSEKDLIDLIEKVYADYKIENSKSFTDAIQQYQLLQRRRNMIFNSRLKEERENTRQIKYETVSIIPKCFKEEVLELKPAIRKWYEVKLPLWYVIKNKDEYKGIIFCDVDYDSKIGTMFIKDSQASSMIV